MQGFGAAFGHFTVSLTNFASAFAIGMLLLSLGAWAIHKITPYDEITLLRQGNLPVGVAFGGKVIGLAIPIAYVTKSATGPIDMILWSLIGVAAQLSVHFILNALLKNQARVEIDDEKLGGATVFTAMAQIATGIINGGCLYS